MSTYHTSREIAASPAEVFAAISDSSRLARWWGPEGFTNTFESCDFRPGGLWTFIMHAPNGTNYPNECRFVEIEAPSRLVIHHTHPDFTLTLTFTPTPAGTLVDFTQVFADPGIGARLAPIVIPANDQNLQRLEAEVLRPQA